MGYINPLLKLPAAAGLIAASEPERRRKGPMAAYWRAVATYARHTAHVLEHGPQLLDEGARP